MATIGIIVDYAAGWTSPRNLYEGTVDFFRLVRGILSTSVNTTISTDYNEGDLFYVWGNLPYSPTRGDYLTDSLLRLIYPNYQDSSYFHNETVSQRLRPLVTQSNALSRYVPRYQGFSSPTPFGDSLDFLLSDAPAWLLGRYDTLLLAGTPQTEPGLLRSKIEVT